MRISIRNMQLTVIATAAAVWPVAAQNLPGDRVIRQYLAAESAKLERELLPDIKTAAAFEKVRLALRDDYLDMLGLKPLPERTPLKATVTGRFERDGYAVEKLHFQ